MSNFFGVGPIRFGVGVSATTTTLGTRDPQLGTRTNIAGNEYCFVYNAGGTATQNQIVVIASGSSGYSVTVSSVKGTDPAFGVAANCILTAAAYGWVMTRGFCDLEPATATTSGMVLAPGTDGQVTDPEAGVSTGASGFAFARAMEQTAACGAAKCYVSCW